MALKLGPNRLQQSHGYNGVYKSHFSLSLVLSLHYQTAYLTADDISLAGTESLDTSSREQREVRRATWLERAVNNGLFDYLLDGPTLLHYLQSQTALSPPIPV